MSLDDIILNDYGQTIQLTFIDTDTDAAADISGYASTIQMVFTDPTGTETAKTATFATDGSDGIIEYTVDTGLLAAVGTWHVRGRVTGATAKLSTVKKSFVVRS